MHIAFYKATDRVFNASVAWWTGGPYSHVELVFEDTGKGTYYCASSSNREHGVRFKNILLTHERWDIYPIKADQLYAYKWFDAHNGQPYDVLGLFGFVGRRGVQDQSKWFCSEAVAAALGIPDPWRFDPNTLYSAARRFLIV